MQIDMGVSHRKAARDIARVPCSCTGMVAGVSDIVPVDGNRGLRVAVGRGPQESSDAAPVASGCAGCGVGWWGLTVLSCGERELGGYLWVAGGWGVQGVPDAVPVASGCGGCRGICGSLGVPVDGNRGLRGYRLIPGGDDGRWPAAGMRFVALHTNVLHWEVCPSHRRKH